MRNEIWMLTGLPILLLGATSSRLAPAAGGAAGLAPQWLVAPADTGQFPLRYCTVLPRPDIAHWDADYAAYARLATPEIRRTQMGLRFVNRDGVQLWTIRPAATAPPQLDTLTRLTDPARAQGHWRSVLGRVVLYCDSVVVSEKRIYRSVQPLGQTPAPAELTLADGRLRVTSSDKPGEPPRQQLNKKYAIVNGRYLLVYGLARSSAGISQIGLDPQGRLLLYSYAVTERKLPGHYLTYQTVVSQTIFERVP